MATTVHVDWEALRDRIEEYLGGFIPHEQRHQVANEMVSAIRGNRLPYITKHVADPEKLALLNYLARGATFAIHAARAD